MKWNSLCIKQPARSNSPINLPNNWKKLKIYLYYSNNIHAVLDIDYDVLSNVVTLFRGGYYESASYYGDYVIWISHSILYGAYRDKGNDVGSSAVFTIFYK